MTSSAGQRISCNVVETRRNDVARIFNIQRYSLNDGEGIRTVVFLKAVRIFAHGVLIRSRSPAKIQTVRREAKCLHCAKCLRDADECPSGAFERIGRDISLDALEREVMKDDIFFRTSGGGVTLSGGEVLMQAEFATRFYSDCGYGVCHAPSKLPETRQPASCYRWRNCAMKCCSI